MPENVGCDRQGPWDMEATERQQQMDKSDKKGFMGLKGWLSQ